MNKLISRSLNYVATVVPILAGIGKKPVKQIRKDELHMSNSGMHHWGVC